MGFKPIFLFTSFHIHLFNLHTYYTNASIKFEFES